MLCCATNLPLRVNSGRATMELRAGGDSFFLFRSCEGMSSAAVVPYSLWEATYVTLLASK